MRRTVHKNFQSVSASHTHTLLNFITLPESDLQLQQLQVLNCSLMYRGAAYRAAAYDAAVLLGASATCTCEPSDLFLTQQSLSSLVLVIP